MTLPVPIPPPTLSSCTVGSAPVRWVAEEHAAVSYGVTAQPSRPLNRCEVVDVGEVVDPPVVDVWND